MPKKFKHLLGNNVDLAFKKMTQEENVDTARDIGRDNRVKTRPVIVSRNWDTSVMI